MDREGTTQYVQIQQEQEVARVQVRKSARKSGLGLIVSAHGVKGRGLGLTGSRLGLTGSGYRAKGSSLRLTEVTRRTML